MIEIILENLINILSAALIALMGILGSLITAKLNEKTRLQSINAAQQELVYMAQQTVGELQQTVVDKLKQSRADGKLTESEIKALGTALVEKTIEKMSQPAIKLLNSAGVDIIALIHGTAEDHIKGSAVLM